MKKYFEIIGIVLLLMFSFYYTDKVASLTNNEDLLKTALETNKEKYESVCKEGIITSDGIIPGKSGKKVDENKSYNNMIGRGFDKDLLIYYDVPCLINKEDNYDKYILRGNSYNNAVSIIIKINDLKYLKDIISNASLLDSKLDIMLNYNDYSKDMLYFKTLIKDNYSFVYNGNGEYYEKFVNIFKNNMFCIDVDMCYEDKINSIKINKEYSKNYLNEIKKNFEKGDFLVLNESETLVEEIKLIINYLEAKGIKIISLKEHLQ